MSQRTITALYDTREAAEAAKRRLTAMNIPGSDVSVHDEGSAGGATSTDGSMKSEGGMVAALKNLFGSHDDSHAYAEGLRRGHVLLTAKMEESRADAAIQALEGSGAVDLDTKENEWRRSGWSAQTAAPTGMAERDRAADRDTTIPIVEERLVVGKREVERGGVRVRSYVVETPVEERVSLRDEHVDVERRVVDRPLAAGEDPFRERTLEMSETGEEAVVGKQAFVTEEIGLKKEVGQRTEEVRDTVRRTEVEVERTGTTDADTPKRV